MAAVAYLVVPCYNEEAVLPETNRRLTEKLAQMAADGLVDPRSRIVYVDDGSRDRTWALIAGFHAENPCCEGLKLAHNAGHQNALLAGMLAVRTLADCVITLDADLQDDIGVLDEFLRRHQDGFEVVYGVRKSRESDTWFKRTSAEVFYRLMRVMGIELVFNHADYRLIGRRALDALSEYREVNLFLRGIIPTVGFPSATVYYDRHERLAGESKYPLKKMLGFAAEGITSFSVKPLKIISNLGIVISLLSVLGLLYALISYAAGSTVPGWTAIVASIWLLGGIQLLCIGVVGEYIGKIYSEVKARPRYIVETFLHDEP